MLPVQNRLKNKDDLKRLFREGKIRSNNVLTIKFKFRGAGSTRVGFGASVKFSKRATQRNKIRRWMRESVRLILDEIKPGYDIFISINTRFPKKLLNFTLIKEKTKSLLRKASILLN